ncbi:LOW QUALITY PROTEIN: B2 bradykinin receptor-like [Acanthochromis polyacanthus]|uniref:LOW QUALITY PROTEIN: B2 bradykinin receptor-like n=1 Tax=Acanthochromis polyacanthus TaxID=80966 RepID=UPI0022342ED8|nr:LOW QUALITY PROTEIN: B2 bradykinin receptor-like [Acanthochromis polyacanthus]
MVLSIHVISSSLKENLQDHFRLYILIISVLGIILNVFVLMVFWLHKTACNVAEIYLCNLAAADLFLMLSLLIWAVNVLTRFDSNLSETMCKLFPFSISMNSDCSIYILVLVSIDRYLALVHPLTHGRKRRPFCAKLACAVVWCVCFLLNVPVLIFMEVVHDPEKNVSRCIPSYSDHIDEVLSILNIILNLIIPILIISFCTLNTLRSSFSTQRKEQKATTLILAVLLAFLICWVPFHVFKILELLSRYNIVGSCEFPLGLFQLISMILAFSNSVLNPILYVCVGENFRVKVREVFSQIKNQRKSTFILITTRVNESVLDGRYV